MVDLLSLVGLNGMTDEQLSNALTAALATDDAKATAALVLHGAYLDPPEFVQQLLNEYKRRHVKPRQRPCMRIR